MTSYAYTSSGKNISCPMCDSPMVKKTGDYGEFLGCERYPKCTCTRTTEYQSCDIKITDEFDPMTHLNTQGVAAEEFLKIKQSVQASVSNLIGVPSHMLRDDSTIDYKKMLTMLLTHDHERPLFEKETMDHIDAIMYGTINYKPTTENKIMNQVQQAVQILNTEYKIAVVIFKLDYSNDSQDHYHYKIPPSINVIVGNDLIVNVSNDPEAPEYKGVRCIKVLPNEESIFIEEKFMKWIVNKVDTSAYRGSKCREDDLIESLEKAMRTKEANDKRKEVVKGLNKKILKNLGLLK